MKFLKFCHNDIGIKGGHVRKNDCGGGSASPKLCNKMQKIDKVYNDYYYIDDLIQWNLFS